MSSHMRALRLFICIFDGCRAETYSRLVRSATITLHNPYLNFSDPRSMSTSRCVNATRSILAAYYRLSETSLDITRLHPFVTVRGIIIQSMFLTDSRFADMLVSRCRRTDAVVQVLHRDRGHC